MAIYNRILNFQWFSTSGSDPNTIDTNIRVIFSISITRIFCKLITTIGANYNHNDYNDTDRQNLVLQSSWLEYWDRNSKSLSYKCTGLETTCLFVCQ